VELETATEKVTENLRKIDEHRRRSSASSESNKTLTVPVAVSIQQNGVAPNIETARQLFEEQLDFLSKEKYQNFLRANFRI
jgi:hypothetical protein